MKPPKRRRFLAKGHGQCANSTRDCHHTTFYVPLKLKNDGYFTQKMKAAGFYETSKLCTRFHGIKSHNAGTSYYFFHSYITVISCFVYFQFKISPYDIIFIK
jgi:hypothetical protein